MERVDILFGTLVLAFLGAILYCYWIMGDWGRRLAALGSRLIRRLIKERDRHN
jgi:hypothetical protein